MVDPEAILEQLDAVRADTLRKLDGLSQEALDWQPGRANGEDVWSLGEIFMHLALDEFYLRDLIARPLLEGITPPEGVQFLPPPPPYGTPKSVIFFWFERARKTTRQMIREWPARANLETRHCGGFEEPMNGAEWLASFGRHERFHHRQIDALIAQAAEALESVS